MECGNKTFRPSSHLAKSRLTFSGFPDSEPIKEQVIPISESFLAVSFPLQAKTTLFDKTGFFSKKNVAARILEKNTQLNSLVNLKSTASKVMRDFAIKVNLFSSQNCPKLPKSSSFFEIKILFTAQIFLRCATIFSAKFISLLYSNLKYLAALKDD